ncbi:hypothetical protein DACRYDRAFT_20751 [Dacryopinax primogenitus]|uniref:Uncharacterized protein n=1 Tax=Dacryopinax primogenitus (strain DJM 731) TaxID=1858805 RepID=M5G1M2_DACPD|nr:uncharacterized protein DACRYDRAFT_20751 [Dacryopinax primogenitus]EJU04116.1 hypothetical protein DACRYDRAFT_20751 [Dacryopinax primogenitus]
MIGKPAMPGDRLTFSEIGTGTGTGTGTVKLLVGLSATSIPVQLHHNPPHFDQSARTPKSAHHQHTQQRYVRLPDRCICIWSTSCDPVPE